MSRIFGWLFERPGWLPIVIEDDEEEDSHGCGLEQSVSHSDSSRSAHCDGECPTGGDMVRAEMDTQRNRQRNKRKRRRQIRNPGSGISVSRATVPKR